MRKSRQFSNTGYYHVIMRGAGRQVIFEDKEDRERFMRLLEKLVEESQVRLHAFCLMDNHFHLLIHDPAMELVKFMQRIGTSYARYYNMRYDHAGHVFQDRYKSEVIDNERYYLTVLRYIIQNPLKANLGMRAVYERTSYASFFERGSRWNKLIVTDLAYELVGGSEEALRSFLMEPNEDMCMEAALKTRIGDEELRSFICKAAGVNSPLHVKSLSKSSRDYAIAQVVKIEPSDSRIERETGVGRTIIRRIRRQAREGIARGVPVG